MKYLLLPLLLLCGCAPTERVPPVDPADDECISSGIIMLTAWDDGKYTILPRIKKE